MTVRAFADVRDRFFRESRDLVGGETVGAGAFHGVHHRVEDLIHDENLFFGQAEQIIVVGRAVNDRFGGTIQIGRFVHDHRRVSRAGDDRAFLLAEGHTTHSRAARHVDQIHERMREEFLDVLDLRLGQDRHQIVDPDRLVDRLVEHLDAQRRDFLPARVGAEHDRVAGGDHVDRVARDRRQRVRDRGNRRNDAVRGVLNDRQTVIAAPALALEEFNPGGHAANARLLLDFVVEPADFRFLHFQRAQLDGVLVRDVPDGVDREAALGDGFLLELLVSVTGGLDRVFQISELTETSDVRTGGSRRIGRSAKLLNHFGHDFADGIFVDVHFSSFWFGGRTERRPRILSLENDFPVHVHRVHDSDRDRVGWNDFRFGRHAGARPLADQNEITLTGPQRVERDERPAGGEQRVLRSGIHAVRLHDEQFPAAQGVQLLRCDG